MFTPRRSIRRCLVARMTLFERLRRARAGVGASLRRSAGTPTALRCAVLWPRRGTRYVRFAHCVRTAATSQLTKRAARAATSPALLGAPEARYGLPTRAFAESPPAPFARTNLGTSRWVASGGGDLGGDEQRRAGVGARQRASSTDSSPLFERSERSERREFGDATSGRAAQCSRRAAATATA